MTGSLDTRYGAVRIPPSGSNYIFAILTPDVGVTVSPICESAARV